MDHSVHITPKSIMRIARDCSDQPEFGEGHGVVWRRSIQKLAKTAEIRHPVRRPAPSTH